MWAHALTSQPPLMSQLWFVHAYSRLILDGDQHSTAFNSNTANHSRLGCFCCCIELLQLLLHLQDHLCQLIPFRFVRLCLNPCCHKQLQSRQAKVGQPVLLTPAEHSTTISSRSSNRRSPGHRLQITAQPLKHPQLLNVVACWRIFMQAIPGPCLFCFLWPPVRCPAASPVAVSAAQLPPRHLPASAQLSQHEM